MISSQPPFRRLWAALVVINSICIGASYLGELLKINSSLHELVIPENNIGNDGISSVAEGLQYNSTLLKLDIANCGISEKGSNKLASWYSINNMEYNT